ncbi:MAG: hypothetical protein JNM00_05685 [Flavobacteriales bacterium]|nr:hypothetical protein [Flavobacteriales bacterium]
MKRLIAIEWQQLWNARYFRILIALWLLAFLAVPVGFKLLLNYAETHWPELGAMGLSPAQLPLFDFREIWQNLAYVYKMFSILFSFIVVISITNDLDYKTQRQHVIDGMSRKEWLLSKWYTILAGTTISALMVFVVTLISGMCFSYSFTAQEVFETVGFIGAYWIHMFLFLQLAGLLAMVIRRSGITIAVMIFWIYVFEPISVSIVRYEMKISWLSNIFPFEASWRLIPDVFPHLLMQPGNDQVPLDALLIAGAYLAVIMSFAWWWLRRKDL